MARKMHPAHLDEIESICTGLNKKPQEIHSMIETERWNLIMTKGAGLGTATLRGIERIAERLNITPQVSRQIYNTFC